MRRIWGGERLNTEFEYEIPWTDTGECWAISAHQNGDCLVRGGDFDGMRLSVLWQEHRELFGNISGDHFPLLVKIIDAKDDLSVQVHPDDTYAMEHENGSCGKTECWYVLSCDSDASIILGHNAQTKEEMAKMIEDGNWNDFLREVPVSEGDFFVIHPGTLHAIKGGILLMEVQQSSDITYRVYDYDREDHGVRRELHQKKAMDVMSVPALPVEMICKGAVDVQDNCPVLLHKGHYYCVWKLEVSGEYTYRMESAFVCVDVLDGEGTVNGDPVKKGDHMIFPTGIDTVKMIGNIKMLLSAPV